MGREMSEDKLDWQGCRTWLENVSLELKLWEGKR